MRSLFSQIIRHPVFYQSSDQSTLQAVERRPAPYWHKLQNAAWRFSGGRNAAYGRDGHRLLRGHSSQERGRVLGDTRTCPLGWRHHPTRDQPLFWAPQTLRCLPRTPATPVPCKPAPSREYVGHKTINSQ